MFWFLVSWGSCQFSVTYFCCDKIIFRASENNHSKAETENKNISAMGRSRLCVCSHSCCNVGSVRLVWVIFPTCDIQRPLWSRRTCTLNVVTACFLNGHIWPQVEVTHANITATSRKTCNVHSISTCNRRYQVDAARFNKMNSGSSLIWRHFSALYEE